MKHLGARLTHLGARLAHLGARVAHLGARLAYAGDLAIGTRSEPLPGAGIHPPCAIFPSVVLVLKDTEVPHAGDRKLESRLITLGAHPRRGTAGRSK